jgi:hypothetical protein
LARSRGRRARDSLGSRTAPSPSKRACSARGARAFKGIFAEFFLDTAAFHFHSENLFEVELEGGKVRVNGREFRVRAAEEYVEELEVARQLARSWQATLKELAEELERDPRGAERRLQRLLEDLAGKV